MLGLLLCTGVLAGNETRPVMPSREGIWVKLNIIFHRRSQDCERGFGICAFFTAGIDGPGVSSEKNGCAARAQLNEKNQLILDVDESALSKYEGGATLVHFRNRTSITLQESFTIPEPVCRKLGPGGTMTIRPGTYPILYQNGVYRITIQL